MHMKSFNLTTVLTVIVMVFCISSCSMGDMYYDESGRGPAASPPDGGDSEEEPGNEGENSQAGKITAGEWNDLDNWAFWSGLMDGQNDYKFYEHLDYWNLYTYNRFAVTVLDGTQQPVCGAKVCLHENGAEEPSWTAITDNTGSAELWYRIDSSESDEERIFTASVNGKMHETPLVRTSTTGEEAEINFLTAGQTSVTRSADIAFIVDATGSMMDEIDFLKDDLLDIIRKAAAQQSGLSIRTAALFYRDKGDEYVTRSENFNKDPQKTLNFIKKQEANGGGDYPEAVHTALEKALQDLSWEECNYARLAFLLSDAPPHHNQKVMESIRKSIENYAANGIKLIPIAASGIDKSTEFLLRLMAIFTDGTYVFITNHSGIGNEHIEPTIGQYDVELLNELIVRLIGKYTE